jgi:DNA-directed RNA polymerase specialized sigma24 family protein
VEKLSTESVHEEMRERTHALIGESSTDFQTAVEAFRLDTWRKLTYRKIAEGLQVTEERARKLVCDARQKFE